MAGSVDPARRDPRTDTSRSAIDGAHRSGGHAGDMRRMRSGVAIGLVAAGLLAASCGGPATGTEVRSHAPRQDPDPAMVPPTALANSSLGTDLFHVLAARDGNFVFS